MTILQTLSATLPVIFLVLLGILIRRMRILQPDTIRDLKNLVVSITLPLLLFKAFGTMKFEARFLIIVAAVFAACTIVMFLSARLHFFPGLTSHYSSYLIAGFEAGILGYALFSTTFGENNISRFAVIDLGQVLFVFFILVPRLQMTQERQPFDARQTVLNFFKTPVIIAIVLGMATNLSGAYTTLAGWDGTSSLIRTVEILAGLTTPLVALVIGYELHFSKGGIALPVRTVALRLFVWVGLALAFNFFVMRGLLRLDRTFEAAVMVMAVLPAPFVVPFYLKEERGEDRDYVLNSLSLGTVVALLAGVLVRLIY